MKQFTEVFFSHQFAVAMATYTDHISAEKRFPGIVLRLSLEMRPNPIRAIVDTGSQWCIFDPAFIDSSIIESVPDNMFVERCVIRGTIYTGKIVRMNVRIETDYGESPDIDATVFVPLLEPGEEWPHPNFIGLEGFLNRIRFAVDPAENAFYFGPV